MNRFGVMFIRGFLFLLFYLLFTGISLGAVIKVVPSVNSVDPGGSLWLDVVVNDIPHEGLSAVQFRLNVDAGAANIAGLSDLSQAVSTDIAVASPILVADASGSTSHIGSYFTTGNSPSGLLVIENEQLVDGKGLYTFAHTNGATLPNGNGGAVARFKVAVGPDITAENLSVTLSEVALLNGENSFDVTINEGAVVALNVSTAPEDITGVSVADKSEDETGSIVFIWTPSISENISGYRIYSVDGSVETLVKEISDPLSAGTEVTGLDSGLSYSFSVKAYDDQSRESDGVTASVTVIDDVNPVINVAGIEGNAYYSTDVVPVVAVTDANLSSQTVTLNGESYSDTTITLDGSYTLAVTAVDAAGNEATKTVSFVIDKTAPSVILSGAAEGNYYSGTVSITASVQDANLDNIVAQVDGVEVESIDGIIEVSQEGSHTVEVKATDKAGHAITKTLSFNIDATAPEEPVLTAGIDGSYLDILSTDISGTAEAGSTVTLAAGSEIYTVTVSDDGAFTIENITLVEGSNNITFTVTDLAGNESSAAGITVTADTLPPAITVANVAQDSYYNSDVTPDISATDPNLSGSVISLNGDPYTQGTVITEEGEYVLVVTATDLAGHETATTLTFTVDKTAPAVAVTGVENGSHYNEDITPVLSVTDTNLSGLSVTLNGEAFTEGTLVGAEGEYTLVVSATDFAGNESDATITFNVDKTAPVITVSGLESSGYYNRDITPALSITDTNLSGSTVTLNGEAFTEGTSVIAEGEYILTISSTDLAGNEATSSLAFTIDKTTPVIAVSGIDSGAYYNSDITPSVSVSDAYLSGQTLTLNGETYDESVITGEGNYSLVVSAVDEAGNEAIETFSFVIDKTAPAITVADVESGSYYNTDITPILSVADTNLSDSSVTLNGQAYRSGVVISAEGEYKLIVSATDLANNEATGTVIFTIDKTAPVIAVAGVENGSYYNTDIIPVLSVTDTTLSSSTATLNGETYDSSVVTEEGNYTLSIKASDEAGNEATQVVNFVIDKTAPVITVSGIEPGVYYNRNVTPLVNTADLNMEGTTVTLNGVAWQSGGTLSFEGPYILFVTATDMAGNGSSYELVFHIDKTAPATVVHAGEPSLIIDGIIYTGDSASFSLTARDDGVVSSGVSGIEYRIDEGGWIVFNGTVPVKGLAEGTHTVYYRASDIAGNVGDGGSTVFVMDVTAPETTLTAASPNYQGESLYVTSATEFTMTSADILSGVNTIEYRVDGGDWTAYVPFSISTEGEHTVEYRSKDNVDNVEATKSVAFTLDSTSPVTTIAMGALKHTAESGEIYVTKASVFALNATDELSGVNGTLYRIDGGDWTAYAPFIIEAEGSHTIDYRSADNVGNVETVNTLAIIVDNSAPVSQMAVSEPNYVANDGNIYMTSESEITITASDSLSGVLNTEYRIGAGDWATYVPIRIVEEGTYLLTYRSRDKVDNVETAQSLTVIVDNTAPKSGITVGGPLYSAPDGSIYARHNSLITIEASDESSGVVSTEYRIDTGGWIAYGPFSIDAEGGHTIEYRSTDNVGNMEEMKSLDLIVDNTPPVSTINVGSPTHTSAEGVVYVRKDTQFTLSTSDKFSGIASVRYRIGGGEWADYAPFTVAEEGEQTIEYVSTDNVGNDEDVKVFAIVVDNSPPVSAIDVGQPKYVAEDGTLYVRKDTLLSAGSSDNLSGVAETRYSVDGNAVRSYETFTIAEEGNHIVAYSAVDNVNNTEVEKNLALTVDNTAPVSEMTIGDPIYETPGGTVYVRNDSQISIKASDNFSGVASTKYRVDGGDWMANSLFAISDEGIHHIEYGSIDNVGNIEAVKTFTLVVDNTPPVSILDLGMPKHEDGKDRVFVTDITPIMLSVTDNLAGVNAASYTIDGGEALSYGIFTISAEGEHVVAYGAVDNVDNVEDDLSATVTVDNTAPLTEIDFSGQVHSDGETVFITKETGVTLNATDNISGVKESYFLLDDGTEPQKYTGLFKLDAIGYGQHRVRFYSKDNVENEEEVKSINVVVIGMDVTTEVLNIPRALVWTTDPSKLSGISKKDYTLDDIKDFIGSALNEDDIYYSVVTDRDAFKSEFRSGIFNTFVIIDEENPFGAEFTKEIREAVNRGAGLVISGWGNNITPKMEELVGLNFKGSLSMDEDENRVQMYESVFSTGETFTVRGKILKTELDGALLAGIIKGNEVCEGTRSIKLNYPVAVLEGDVVSVRLTAKGKGKKVNIIDEEEVVVTGLPMMEIFNSPGSESGDLGITSVTSDGISISMTGFAGAYLAAEYDIEVLVEHEDGIVDETSLIRITAGCEGSPEAGMQAGPFTVVEVDRVVTTDLTDRNGQHLENLPAAVVNEYGKGRAVMFTFNIVESAINGDGVFADILRNAINYAKPEGETVEAADMVLIEKKITLYGTGMDIRTAETLDDKLNYVKLFDLNRDKLEYFFSLEDGESHSYRYFLRMPDMVGDFFIETSADINVGGAYQFFGSYEDILIVSDASSDFLSSALAWMELKKGAYPDEGEKISGLMALLEGIDALPKTDEGDLRKVIHDTVQFIDKLKQFSFDTSELRLMLDDYIKVLASKPYSLKL